MSSFMIHLVQRTCELALIYKVENKVVEKADETDFVINMTNGKMIDFRCEKEVKYSDVVSGEEAMTMVVRISGGPQPQI